jgi:hypothetical protein
MMGVRESGKGYGGEKPGWTCDDAVGTKVRPSTPTKSVR